MCRGMLMFIAILLQPCIILHMQMMHIVVKVFQCIWFITIWLHIHVIIQIDTNECMCLINHICKRWLYFKQSYTIEEWRGNGYMPTVHPKGTTSQTFHTIHTIYTFYFHTLTLIFRRLRCRKQMPHKNTFRSSRTTGQEALVTLSSHAPYSRITPLHFNVCMYFSARI